MLAKDAITQSIFVATVGVEPQVVTLTLDALLLQEQNIARVVVVHTAPDLEPVRTSLQRLHDEFVVRQHYGNRILYAPHVLSGDSGPLVDITTAEEIEKAFQSLYTLLRHHKQARHRIHLCIAGGRKTMALFAMAAAQILFEPSDHVWHLISNPSLIASKQFHANHPGDVSLISIPIASWARMRTDDQSRAHYFMESVLTPAERKAVELLVREGLSNSALAIRLHKSAKTIANQLSSVYVKLADYYELVDVPDRSLLLVLLGSYS